jgi:Domain of unknown function (DUF4145)
MRIDDEDLKDFLKEREVDRKRLYCNWCKQETNHEVKGQHTTIFNAPDEMQEVLIFRLWICMGCEKGMLEKEYLNEFMGEDEEELEYFPKRSRNALAPKSYSKLRPELTAIYREAITCYNEQALILCTAGLRALLEGICQDKRIKGRNLKAKIDGLKAILPNKNIIRNLHHFRFMGNDAVHELAAPKPNELALAIDVIEDLLNFLYEMDYKASQLRELRRSNRPRRIKPNEVVSSTVSLPPTP